MTARSETPVCLVGAGPAGVSVAIWLDDYGVPFDWIDARGRVGGMLRRVHNRIDDYPGRVYEDGSDLAADLRRHLKQLRLSPRRATLQRVDATQSERVVVEVDSTRYVPERLIVATGTKYRRLNIPGEAEAMDQCISQSAMADAPRVAGRHVAVVGGGDSGFENARVLAEHDCRVTMLLRNDEFRARPAFVEAVKDNPAITIAPIPSVVRRIETLDDGCRLHVDRRGEQVTVEVAALFVRIGVDPRLPDGCDTLETDERGFLTTDRAGHTSHPRILAAGDIVSTPLRSVATAVGDGAIVARTCAAELGFL